MVSWKRVELTVQGGFAGLKRGASLDCASLGHAEQNKLGGLVTAICAIPSPVIAQHPDGESVAIDVHSESDTVCRVFDSADLPHPAAELLDLLRPHLKPLPRD